MAKFGDYLFGNILTFVIAGAATFAWCFLLDVPYAVAARRFSRDRGPVPAWLDRGWLCGRLGGADRLDPGRVATVAFYIAFRLAEDYLLTPKIIGRAVKVPGGVTVVAVMIGAALLGVVGALAAIPVAAALCLRIAVPTSSINRDLPSSR